MALGDVRFVINNTSGLNRIAQGEDHISALIFAIAPPALFGTAKIKMFNNVSQLATAGILKGIATYGVVYYHAVEFFRIAPGATLYIGFNTTVQELFSATNGSVKQIGTYITTLAEVATWQTNAAALDALFAPVVIVAGWNAALTPAAATDLNTQNAPNVSVLVSGDGGYDGAALATSLGVGYIPALGAVLGATAKARVHENIGWVAKFNLSNNLELDTVRLSDGTNNAPDASLTIFNDKNYLVLRKRIGISGSYISDNHTAIISTNDYSKQNDVRVINKVKRVVRAALLPALNSPIDVNAQNGTIAVDSIKYFENLALSPLNTMEGAQEITDAGVYIDPNQNILATSKLLIQIRIVARGVVRNIDVDLALAKQL